MASVLPPWAHIMHKALEMVAGKDFQPGDVIYFSARAYPRILWKKLSSTSWSVMEDHGVHHKPGRISINPDSYYVIKRALHPGPAQPADEPKPTGPFDEHPLNSMRVEGRDLEIGDVLYMDRIRGRAEIVHIGPLKMTARGEIREARLHFLDTKKVEPYIFSGFKIQPPFSAIAGPKFEAARQDPSRVFWREGVRRWEWKG